MKQEARLLGLDDDFYFGARVFVFLAGFVWLARPAPAKKPAAPSLVEAEAEELME